MTKAELLQALQSPELPDDAPIYISAVEWSRGILVDINRAEIDCIPFLGADDNYLVLRSREPLICERPELGDDDKGSLIYCTHPTCAALTEYETFCADGWRELTWGWLCPEHYAEYAADIILSEGGAIRCIGQSCTASTRDIAGWRWIVNRNQAGWHCPECAEHDGLGPPSSEDEDDIAFQLFGPRGAQDELPF